MSDLTYSQRRVTRQTRQSARAGLADEPSLPIRSTKRRGSENHNASTSKKRAPNKDIAETKRRKVNSSEKKNSNANLYERLFGVSGTAKHEPCIPPVRHHVVTYHRPLLLDDISSRRALLDWFGTVSKKRAMPWRKPWICPSAHDDEMELRKLLEKRAYEVWISEIMLQQTRVSVVIDYWNKWMAKWPTIQDLADAESDEVLSAWRGLGYYSRATRIHEAAKLVTQDPIMNGLLPSDPKELEAKIPGVGRYTAGAISAIVFGQPVPMVDGNVLRVLSRQLGLYGNTKTDKAIIDMTWAAADALVKAATTDPSVEQGHDQGSTENGDRPGAWGQALMELGSTVCTPKPNCSECPISLTCRAFVEGKALAQGRKASSTCSGRNETGDIEDLCHLCEPFEPGEDGSNESGGETSTPDISDSSKTTTKQKRGNLAPKISRFFKGVSKPDSPPSKLHEMETIINHARRFPPKPVKNAVKLQETLVCIIRQDDGRYLIQKRPPKGLLANLWEFPSRELSVAEHGHTSAKNRTKATSFVKDLIRSKSPKVPRLKYIRYLDSIPWLFSHIKLTMHVYDVSVDKCSVDIETDRPHKWVTDELVDQESMGTGMRKCWTLMKQSRNGSDDSDQSDD